MTEFKMYLETKTLPHVFAMQGYAPGLQLAEQGWIKLNTNESPYEPSPQVNIALLRSLSADAVSLRLYPNPRAEDLRVAIAQHHHLQGNQVIVGNGSDDVLNLLVRAFVGGESSAAACWPSYSLYPVLVSIQGGHIKLIDYDRSLKLPLERIVASGANILFLTAPNAPTGVGFSPDQVETLLNVFKGVVVVDEAYAPFARYDAVALLQRYPNLVITRTFSKAYALAGMRVGYALAHPDIIELLDRVRDSYNVNRLSQVAALAALQDQAYYQTMIGRIIVTRDNWYREWTTQYGWFVYASEANFLFFEPVSSRGNKGVDVAASLYEFLYKNKILVRKFPSHPLTASFLRITVGTDEQMVKVNEVLKLWLQNVSAL